MEIEDAVNLVNGGKYTFAVAAFIALTFTVSYHYGQFQVVLLSLVTPNYNCEHYSYPKDNLIRYVRDPAIRKHPQCSIYNKSINNIGICDKWNYSEEPVGVSIISEFNLVCQMINYHDLIIILWNVVSLVGFAVGSLADIYGRKKVLIINVFLETIFTLALAFSPNITCYIIFKVFASLCSSSVYISYVWLIEIVDTKFRDVVGAFFPIFGCIASMTYPLITYLLRNWRIAQICIIIPSILYFTLLFIPDSPRWLLINKRRDEAINSLHKIAMINGIRTNIEIQELKLIVDESKDEELPYLEALRSKLFLKRTLITFLLHYSIYSFFSAATLNIKILSKNIYISMFFIAAMEIPGYLLTFLFLGRVNRKLGILISALIGSFLFLISAFLSYDVMWQSILKIITGSLAMVAIVSCDQIMILFVSELFPTSVRNINGIFVQTADVLGYISALYINKLSKIYNPLPIIIYSTFMISWSVLIQFLLPETKDKSLPENLDDQIPSEISEKSFLLNKHRRSVIGSIVSTRHSVFTT